MTIFLIVLHVLVCVFLILFVLLQPGARGGVGAAFGGAGGATVFGGRGANTFLAKLTGASAVIFMLTSISLSYFVSKSSSVMKDRVPAAAAKVDDAADEGKDAAKDAPLKIDVAPAAAPAAAPPAAPAPDGSTPPAAPEAKPVGEAPPAP